MRKPLAVSSLTACCLVAWACVSACASHVPTAEGRLAVAHPFTVVDLRPTDGDLETQLAREAARAVAWRERPFVELTSRLCDQCHWLDHGLGDPRLSQAFSNTYIVRVDVDRWNGRLGNTGLLNYATAIPAFVALDADGTPTQESIDIRAWNVSTPANAAGALRNFFQTAAFVR
jgi:hypothetical protein